jgi:hypothetical protein
VLWCAGHTASLVSKYRPAMPILTLVIPQLKTESMKWKLEGRAVARQCQISRSLFPVLAAPSPSGQSSSFIALLFSLLFSFSFFFLLFSSSFFFFFSSHFLSCLVPLLLPLLLFAFLLSSPSSAYPGFHSAPCCFFSLLFGPSLVMPDPILQIRRISFIFTACQSSLNRSQEGHARRDGTGGHKNPGPHSYSFLLSYFSSSPAFMYISCIAPVQTHCWYADCRRR